MPRKGYPYKRVSFLVFGGEGVMLIYLFFGVAVFALLIWAFYFGVAVRRYTVKSQKIKTPFRIVQISDLHSVYHGREQECLMRRIERLKPDMVVLTGDIFDVRGKEDGALSFLKHICRYPCFYVLGNHEYCSKKAEKYTETAQMLGICVLQNETEMFCVNGNEIMITGINDPQRADKSEPKPRLCSALEQAFGGADETKFNLFLAHSHIYIDEYKKYGYDLGMSGHSHGGQFRIPLIMNGFFCRKQGFFPGYAGGEYRFGDKVHIVSRGISAVPRWLPRIFNRTEIVAADICPKEL